MAEKDPRAQLVQSIKDDFNDRSDWEDRAKSLQDHRLSKRKRSSIYPGAPNFVDPIIDDNVRDAVSQEMSVLFSSQQLANFLGLTPEAVQAHRDAEMGFDTMLRMLLGFRRKIENAFDNKRGIGMTVLKLVENDTAYERFMASAVEIVPTRKILPDLEVVSPYDFVVPTATENLQDAERACHVKRYTPRMLKTLGEKRSWENVEEIIRLESAQEETRGSGPYSDHQEIGKELQITGDDTNASVEEIEVWEIYHYDSDGKPRRTILSPNYPDKPLDKKSWIWSDGTRRPFPFVQLRNENRETTFYDTRGDAELLLDNQKEATAYMNAKGVQLDFFAKPMFKGSKKNGGKATFSPGSYLPEGTEPVNMPQISSVFDFGADSARAKAARRSGASQGGFAKAGGRGDKTATQVNAEQLNASRQVNVSSIRDGDPLSEFFFMMWEFLRHNPIPLPMFENETQFKGMTDGGLFQLPYLIQAAANAQNANPDFVLQQMMTLGPMLQQSQFVRQDELMRLIVDQVNPHVTKRLVVNPDEMGPQGQPTINQQLQQMQQGMEQMMQGLQQIGQQVQAQGEYLQQIAEAEAQEGQEEARGGSLAVA